jgi:hypothetical protein
MQIRHWALKSIPAQKLVAHAAAQGSPQMHAYAACAYGCPVAQTEGI